MQGVRTRYVSALVTAIMTACTSSVLAGGPDQPQVTLGVYVGLGGAWATVDNSVNWETYVATATSSQTQLIDGNLKDSQSRLAPMAQIGYSEMIDEVWLWSLALQYKYLGYAQNTLNGVNQVLYHVNTSTTATADLSVSLQQQLMLLLSFGGVVGNQIFYLGIGSVMYTLHDSVRHYPTGGSFVSQDKDSHLFGGAFQLGYNYYFDPTWFLQMNYTYVVMVESQFSNMVNRNYFQTGTASGVDQLILSREYNMTAQEVMFSLNKVFAV